MALALPDIEPILRSLHHTRDPSEACYLIDDLADFGVEVIDALITALGSSEPEIRSGGALALAYVADYSDNELDASRAVPYLTKTTKDPNPWVRLRAAKALWHITLRPTWIEHALACLDCDDPEVRLAVAEMLRFPGMRNRIGISSLVEHLEDPALEVRFAVAEAVRCCGEEASEAVPRLMDWVNSDLPEEVFAASLAIPAIEPVYREAMVRITLDSFEELQPRFRPKAVYMLSQDEDTLRQALPMLARYYNPNEPEELRLAVIQMLAKYVIDTGEGLANLVPAILDDDLEVADAAAHPLFVLGPKAALAVPNLIVALERQLGAEIPARRREREDRSIFLRAAIHDLVEIGSAAYAAIPALKRALEDQDDDVSDAAQEALETLQREGS